MNGSHQIGTRRLLPAIPRGVGVQVPPTDPESWGQRVFAEDSAEAAEKYARRDAGDDWL